MVTNIQTYSQTLISLGEFQLYLTTNLDNVYVYKVYVDNGEAAKEAADKAADETFEIFLKTHAAMHKCCACLYSKDETYIG